MLSGSAVLGFAGRQQGVALSGVVPRIAIVHGRCFAGNAVLAGCADLIVATEGSSLGMGGPAMIAGGGLGEVHPDEVGPAAMQAVSDSESGMA